MSPITSHVLDTALGLPAQGLAVALASRGKQGGWQTLAERVTNADGRVLDLLDPGALESGIYRLTFETGVYFRTTRRPAFYPEISVIFEVDDAEQHYHVPLLLSPFGYTTYRGS